MVALISLVAFWVCSKKLYFIYENVGYEKVTLVGNGYYQSGRRVATSVIFKSAGVTKSMLLKNIMLTKSENNKLQALAGGCVVTEGFNTSLYGYIALDIKSCSGDTIFKRGPEWYKKQYKTFSFLDKGILISSIFGLVIGLSYSVKLSSKKSSL